MNAADLTALMRRSVSLRLSLWGLWLVGSLPAAHAILTEPRLFFLRSLPVSRRLVVVVHGLLLALAELPWIVLHGRGDGALSGMATACAAMALHAWLVARLRPAGAMLLALAVLAALFMAAAAPWLLAASLPLLAVSLPYAYVHAPERAASAGPSLLSPRMGATLALSFAYVVLLWRGQRPLLLRGVLLCLLAGAITVLAVHNNDIASLDGQNTLSLGILSVPLLLSLVSLASPILRAEAQLDWLLSTGGMDGRRRVLATGCALVFCGSVLCAAHGAVVCIALSPAPSSLPRILGLLGGLGLAVAAVAQACVRFTDRGSPKDSDRLLFLLLGVIPLCIVCAWLFHEALLVPWAMAALAGTEASVRRVLPVGRFERLRHERTRRAGDDL